LSDRAVEILKAAKELGSIWCFPSSMNKKRPMSNMAMDAVLKRLGYKVEDEATGRSRATVHGMRSPFRDWAAEVAQRERQELAREDVIEACLAHKEKDRVKAAYLRTKFDDKRREPLA